jgi:VWFA-related protein
VRAGNAILVSAAVVGAAGVLGAQQAPPPQFRAEIEYVEVDARVLDQQGQPIRDLTQKDFAVFEDGVRQTLTNFSVVDIPVTTATPGTISSAGVTPDVSNNTLAGDRRRTYVIVLDDCHISPRWTNDVRTFLRAFIERSIAADDLVGIATTGKDAAYENFTNDKRRLIAAVNRMVGQSKGSPALSALNDRASRSTPARRPPRRIADADADDPCPLQIVLMPVIQAMSGAGAGSSASKAIVLVTESIGFDTITDTEGLRLIGDADRLSAQARRSNVPIYPVDPRGLSSGFESAVEVRGVGVNDDPALAFLVETRRSQDQLRALADDSGGLPIVGVNDIDGGLDRIVAMSSFYYVLGYYSTNGRRDGKYRKINVTVGRPGARVLNRRGYTAAGSGGRRGPSLAGPPKSSVELREALNAVLPTAGVSLAMTAAAFRQANGRASIAVVIETEGADLLWQDDTLAAPLELTAAALDKRGAIKTGDVETLRLSRSETATRVKQYGFRWLARLDDLKPGRYQIRGAAANGAAKQGSVWYDIDVPDFAKDQLTISDVMLASAAAMLRPTLRPDKLLADALPGPPTTLRAFPEGSTIALYAEVYDNQLDRPHDVEASVVVTNEQGEVVFRTTETRTSRQLAASGGVLSLKIGIPLVNIRTGNYTLGVDARQTVNRAISAGRAVPFQVVRSGGR